MEKELPKNWIEVQLRDILDVLENGSRPKGGVQGILEGIPSLGGEHLNNDGGFKFGNLKFVPELFADKMKRGLINEKDILIVKDGATTGKTSFVDNNFPFEKAFVNEHVFIARTFSNLNSKAIFYFLRSKIGQDRLMENFTGSAQGGINQKFANNTSVPLPPLAEQNRIVEKLDRLFGQLEGIKSSMEKIPVLLKNFRQQVLTQAVTGKLTEEWREGKELTNEFSKRIKNINSRELNFVLPDNWIECSFDSIVQIKSNLVEPNLYLDYPLITPDVIQSQTGILLAKPLVSDILPVSPKHYFKKGDIIYSKIRPYLSKLIIADFDGLCSADMYPISTDLNFKYLFFYMLSNEFLYFATTAGERSVLPKINQKGLNVIPIPTPSLEEQQEIVSRVESLFAKADAIEEKYKNLKAKIETLPQTILHKAFKGELSEQLESDGDARDLLEEIMALKSGDKPKKAVSKKYIQPDDEVLRIVAEESSSYPTLSAREKKVQRKMLATHIINRSLEDQSFGKTKFEKLLHLVEYHILQRDLNQNYSVQAAGPYDGGFTKNFWDEVLKSKWFALEEKGSLRRIVSGSNQEKSLKDYGYFSDEEKKKINDFIKIFDHNNYEKPEIVSTLYAVWNNRIKKNESITDDLLKEDFLNWDSGKARYKDRLDKTLEWMKENGVVPNGWGKEIKRAKK